MKYVLSSLALVSTAAIAHPGHDHADWTASLLHALWYAPIVVAAVAVTYYLVKKFKK